MFPVSKCAMYCPVPGHNTTSNPGKKACTGSIAFESCRQPAGKALQEITAGEEWHLLKGCRASRRCHSLRSLLSFLKPRFASSLGFPVLLFHSVATTCRRFQPDGLRREGFQPFPPCNCKIGLTAIPAGERFAGELQPQEAQNPRVSFTKNQAKSRGG
jgi:hypothetical protein